LRRNAFGDRFHGSAASIFDPRYYTVNP
jgi:hypothetical protein